MHPVSQAKQNEPNKVLQTNSLVLVYQPILTTACQRITMRFIIAFLLSPPARGNEDRLIAVPHIAKRCSGEN